jgi:hypothetical protein
MLNHNEVNHPNQNGMNTVKRPIIIPAVTLDAEDLRELAAIREQSQPGQESQPETLSLAAFVEDFGSGLMEAVRSQNPPIFTGETKPARETLLAGLKRKLFSAQAKAVHAATTLLCDHDEKSAIINGEMGVGKSTVGIAIAALLHQEGYPRTLILSPPHLVYKWRREILDTVPQAEVVILNGADTLTTLQRLRQTADCLPKHPAFYILGRVRLRMGHHWRVAVHPRLAGAALRTPQKDREAEVHPHYALRQRFASCPQCMALVKSALGTPLLMQHMPTHRKKSCESCGSPLWTQVHPQSLAGESESSHSVLKTLCQLPGIGKKRAQQLVGRFGERFLERCLSDNIQQFVQLMDEKGEFIFSDKQAAQLSRALARTEITLGQSGYQASEYIKRYLPKGFFSLLIADEAHDYKSAHSAQGQAMGVLADQVKKIVLLTGTLMGGYADDLFFLLWRISPRRMMEDGYRYNTRRSLGSAAMAFLETHGVLKKTFRTHKEDGDFRTSKAKRGTMHVTKAPGFGPLGIMQYLLPVTVFIKLRDIDGQVLPPYSEHFLNVTMTEEQAAEYIPLEHKLMGYLREALKHGDHSLLGVVINCLLAWPDCCFREEIVRHPRKEIILKKVPVVLNDDPSPKEEAMVQLCLDAKNAGRRTLLYTVYTGTRDTTGRLKSLLERAGLKPAVLRATVAADKREEWIADQVDRDIDVLICHPELVKTGLDLLAFPTIVFMQTGFSVYTLMQAARRSWRIGQKQAVEVYFLGYEETAQIRCLSLMAKKIAVTQSTAGTMPESGLDVLNQNADSVEVALAKQLLQDN